MVKGLQKRSSWLACVVGPKCNEMFPQETEEERAQGRGDLRRMTADTAVMQPPAQTCLDHEKLGGGEGRTLPWSLEFWPPELSKILKPPEVIQADVGANTQ